MFPSSCSWITHSPRLQWLYNWKSIHRTTGSEVKWNTRTCLQHKERMQTAIRRATTFSSKSNHCHQRIRCTETRWTNGTNPNLHENTVVDIFRIRHKVTSYSDYILLYSNMHLCKYPLCVKHTQFMNSSTNYRYPDPEHSTLKWWGKSGWSFYTHQSVTTQ